MTSEKIDLLGVEPRELASIIAGLRALQELKKEGASTSTRQKLARMIEITSIADDHGRIKNPLKAEEIDALCERLNTGA